MSHPIDHTVNRLSGERPRPETAASRQRGTDFANALQAAQRGLEGRRVVIQPGDTLRGLVRQQLGANINETVLTTMVDRVAQANGLTDPNRILAGNTLDLSILRNASASRSTPNPRVASSQHRVLSQTLDRAVDKGYVKPQERASVEQRIVAMGKRYGFAPDDFARMVLMESDGLNPEASNGRCHGIIQFCEGQGRGADSVGMRGRAHEIAKMSVSQQLNLVERYLQDVGLEASNPSKTGALVPQRLRLDDLYLSVLTPSARSERQANVPLNIAGEQARALYVNADRERGITRQSITRGLQQHAQRVLRQHETLGGNAAATQRQHVAARNSYVEVAVLDTAAAKLRPSRP